MHLKKSTLEVKSTLLVAVEGWSTCTLVHASVRFCGVRGRNTQLLRFQTNDTILIGRLNFKLQEVDPLR